MAVSLEPNEFVATMENEYVVPGRKSLIVQVVVAVVQLPVGEPVTV